MKINNKSMSGSSTMWFQSKSAWVQLRWRHQIWHFPSQDQQINVCVCLCEQIFNHKCFHKDVYWAACCFLLHHFSLKSAACPQNVCLRRKAKWENDDRRRKWRKWGFESETNAVKIQRGRQRPSEHRQKQNWKSGRMFSRWGWGQDLRLFTKKITGVQRKRERTSKLMLFMRE